MKKLTAILGTTFVMFVSVAAIDRETLADQGTTVQAAQHASHDADMKCCDSANGMCARDAKDGKCCQKPDCCKDDCCKDGKCKDNCSCECCKGGGCGKHEGAQAGAHKADCCKKDGSQTGAAKDSCCKPKGAQAKKPALIPSH